MRIVLIYNNYFEEGVGIKTEELSRDSENKVYHVPQEEAQTFIKENGHFDKILFTDKILPENKLLFSKKPYNAKEMG